MKTKMSYYVLLATILFVNKINGQTIFQKKDSSLSISIQSSFFSEPFVDSCYTGIHFITIEPQQKGGFNINISGELNPIYKKRIESIISSSTSIWDKKLINDCIKNKKLIIQPILFDINRNCAYRLNDSSKHSFDKNIVYETSIKLLVQRQLSLVESFKQLLPQGDEGVLNYIILSPCYISSRPLEKKIEI